MRSMRDNDVADGSGDNVDAARTGDCVGGSIVPAARRFVGV
jgi:hypothetical protein